MSETGYSPIHPFRRAVLRGLALLLPPLLTVVIFVWVWNTIREHVLIPVEDWTRYAIVLSIEDIRETQPTAEEAGGNFVEVADTGRYIPFDILERVKQDPGPEGMPDTASGVYDRYVDLEYLNWYQVLPVFLCGLLLCLYALGKFLAVGIGRILWNTFDGIIHRLPLIRNVYGSVKQITDFLFSEREVEYTRVVAVEYPRKGIWSLGFVTGEGMRDIRCAAGEPIMTVLMPTSPMPATGFTVTVMKSETVDLNITVDQAFQFIISCGVVVPKGQEWGDIANEIQAAIAKHEAQKSDVVEAVPTPLTTETPLEEGSAEV